MPESERGNFCLRYYSACKIEHYGHNDKIESTMNQWKVMKPVTEKVILFFL